MQREPSPSDSAPFSARDLACWGLLDAARREAARDRVIAAEPMPPQAVFEVLLSQWAQGQGLTSQAALASWLAARGLDPDDLPALVARSWRWQQWCERSCGAQLNSHFLARKAALDQVTFWRLLCGDGDLAAELYQQLREGETRFEQLAQQGSSGASAGDGASPWRVEHTGPVALEQLGGELAGLLRVSEVGVVWSPRPAAGGALQIVMLEQRQPVVLDEALRRQLLEELGAAALQQHDKAVS